MRKLNPAVDGEKRQTCLLYAAFKAIGMREPIRGYGKLMRMLAASSSDSPIAWAMS